MIHGEYTTRNYCRQHKLLLVADPDKWGEISFATGVDMSANIAKPQLYSFEKNTYKIIDGRHMSK